ncbi:hypothetical protein FSP39_025252 [Pinctada imbricata]|uniref:POPDC1-3 domain-containing protein n=1 Tax=Pinctada imbricata TaxID=66713 RepID=A0AA88Y703_PINIB|nr:hypothetical protein FSP39_025252 [Pinctada imbricata]
MDILENTTSISADWSSAAQFNMSIGPSLTTSNNVSISFQNGRCEDWKEAQHALFQLANLCLIIAFLTPTNFQNHALCVRCILGLGYLFFTLWTGLIVCMPDILAWNIGFFVINFLFTCYITYEMLPTRFDFALDELYTKMFKPLNISRKVFKELLSIGSVSVLAKHDIYAQEGSTLVGTKTSILLKGRMKATYQEFFLHHIEQDHFVDSPEFDAIHRKQTEDTYQVTIHASEDCLLLTWPFPELRRHLDKNPFLAKVFQLLIGKDVSNKLYQIQELLLNNPRYMESVISRQSSMVNLRSALVTHNAINDQEMLSCFGIDVKGNNYFLLSILSLKTLSFLIVIAHSFHRLFYIEHHVELLPNETKLLFT